jgi:hypothetical protein
MAWRFTGDGRLPGHGGLGHLPATGAKAGDYTSWNMAVNQMGMLRPDGQAPGAAGGSDRASGHEQRGLRYG